MLLTFSFRLFTASLSQCSVTLIISSDGPCGPSSGALGRPGGSLAPAVCLGFIDLGLAVLCCVRRGVQACQWFPSLFPVCPPGKSEPHLRMALFL